MSRRARRTILIMGEGECDKAFLQHLNGAYGRDNCSLRVTPASAHGKGPPNVINKAVTARHGIGYDCRVALIDRDLAHMMTPGLEKLVRDSDLIIIWSYPCLEGLLLEILEERVPTSSNDCKRAMNSICPGKGTERAYYAKPFPREVLERRRNDVSTLNELINLITRGHL